MNEGARKAHEDDPDVLHVGTYPQCVVEIQRLADGRDKVTIRRVRMDNRDGKRQNRR